MISFIKTSLIYILDIGYPRWITQKNNLLKALSQDILPVYKENPLKKELLEDTNSVEDSDDDDFDEGEAVLLSFYNFSPLTKIHIWNQFVKGDIQKTLTSCLENQITLKQLPETKEKEFEKSQKKIEFLFNEEGSFFGQSEKRLDLGSKDIMKKCPFLNTLSKPT